MANEIGSFISQTTSGFNMGNIGNAIAIFLIIVIFGILCAVGTVWFINKLKYNKIIKVFRRVGNEIVPVFTDVAMFERIGMAGDYWCRMKKAAKILPRPRKQMEKNTFWFYERDDGEWCNFSLGDFDNQMKKAGAYFVDEDMRLQRLGIQKNLQTRFQKVTFWEKYGGMIISIIYILIVTVCLVILFNKMTDAWTKASEMAGAVREMAIEVRNLRTGTQSGAVLASLLPIGLLFNKRVKKYANEL